MLLILKGCFFGHLIPPHYLDFSNYIQNVLPLRKVLGSFALFSLFLFPFPPYSRENRRSNIVQNLGFFLGTVSLGDGYVEWWWARPGDQTRETRNKEEMELDWLSKAPEATSAVDGGIDDETPVSAATTSQLALRILALWQRTLAAAGVAP